ncbi:MAG: putative rane protein [Polaromonas sp.]|nr:putative rane protein [Polaromonas sp.]
MHRLVQQASGYLVVGGLAAVVDIGLFHLLTRGQEGSALLQGVLVPAVLSFCVAAVVNYLLSALWVYRRQWRSLRRAAMFLLFAVVGLCINAGATWWLAHALPILPTLAKIGGVGVAFIANFLMNTFIVFRAGDR